MRLCPLDLETCARPECASGYCIESCEPALYVCAQCGATGERVTIARVGICLACAAVEREAEPRRFG